MAAIGRCCPLAKLHTSYTRPTSQWLSSRAQNCSHQHTKHIHLATYVRIHVTHYNSRTPTGHQVSRQPSPTGGTWYTHTERSKDKGKQQHGNHQVCQRYALQCRIMLADVATHVETPAGIREQPTPVTSSIVSGTGLTASATPNAQSSTAAAAIAATAAAVADVAAAAKHDPKLECMHCQI